MEWLFDTHHREEISIVYTVKSPFDIGVLTPVCG